MDKLQEIKDIINNKLVDPQGVSFMVYLESMNESNAKVVESRISTIISRNIKSWRKLISLLEIKSTDLKMQFRVLITKLQTIKGLTDA